jgi:uncharacterized protein HemY
MRAALWLLALFAIAVAFTLLARLDHGYVIVVFPPWRMEMSFLLTIALLAGAYVLINIALKLARTALRLPEDLRDWHHSRRQKAADHALFQAMQAHLDEDHTALKKALKLAEHCSQPELIAQLRKRVETAQVAD